MHPCFRARAYLYLFLVLLSSGCQPAPPPAPPAGETGSVGTPEGRFVGSQACAPCHAAEARAWEGSAHRRALSTADADAAAITPAEGQAAYLAGGKHRRDLWVRMADGRLQVSPTSFDVDAGRTFEPLSVLEGGPPPADTVDFWTRPGRNAALACYGCHATGEVLTVAGADARGFPIPGSRWVEPGIGCEGCHGPGGPHVDAARAGKKPPMPTRGATTGDARARVAACGGCHALHESLRSPFSLVPAHGYGVPVWEWADPRMALPDSAEFRQAAFPDLRPATFQQEAAALAQSGCARKGGLTCERCHDPHAGTVRAEAAGDRACLPCHEAIAARAEAHARHRPGSPGGRCADCHLAPILRGPGSAAAHDHSLTPPVAGEGEVPAACAQCHLASPGVDRAAEAARLVRGWAAFPKGGAASRRRAAITRAFAPGAPGSLLAALAADPEEAWTARTVALDRLAELPPPSRAGLARQLRPLLLDANPAIRRAAVRTLPGWGAAEDLVTLDRLTQDRDPFLALEAVAAYGALGTPDYGARVTEAARRPDLAAEFRAQLALGRAALLAEDWPRAETALARALDLRPFLVPALNDLGIARFRQGKAVEAQQAWIQALEINPRFEAAKRNLEGSKR